MFDSLLESKAKRAPRVGGSLVSVASHGVLIALIVALTANAGVVTQEERVERTTFLPPTPPPPPPPPVEHVPDDRVLVPAPKGMPSLVPPIEIPDVIAAPDLLKPVTNLDDWKPVGVRGGRADGDSSLTQPVRVNETSVFTASTVDRWVVMAPGSAGPSYPELLRASGIDGTVLAQFVVDTTGRADLSSLVILESAHPLFSEAVRRALPRTRFLPAEVGGRRVRQLVQQPFRFGLDRE